MEKLHQLHLRSCSTSSHAVSYQLLVANGGLSVNGRQGSESIYLEFFLAHCPRATFTFRGMRWCFLSFITFLLFIFFNCRKYRISKNQTLNILQVMFFEHSLNIFGPQADFKENILNELNLTLIWKNYVNCICDHVQQAHMPLATNCR